MEDIRNLRYLSKDSLQQEFDNAWREENKGRKDLKLTEKELKAKPSKIIKIENGIIYYAPTGEEHKKHTPESRKKLSIARRNRTVQPREGTSKKPKNFLEQLKKEYPIKALLKSKNEAEVRKAQNIDTFLKSKAEELGGEKEHALEMGIITDYQEQYYQYSEVGVDEVLYDPQREETYEFEEEVDESIDDILFEQSLKEEVGWYLEDGMTEEFINALKDVRKKQYILENKLPIQVANQAIEKYIKDTYPQFQCYFL